jgi:hypothetical protein
VSIKINLKDIPAATSAQGTDKVLLCWGVDGAPTLVNLSQLGVAPISGASGIILTCPQNGFSYQVSPVIVDGQVSFSITKVSSAGQFTSVLCQENSVTYQLSIQLVNGVPTLTPVAL